MNAAAMNVVGVDLAKNVFQAYWVEPGTGEIKNVQIKRAKFREQFVNLAPCIVGMEACGGAQHWARELAALGHDVVMLPAQSVKGFVTGNKSDAIDARAIWMAVCQGGIKRVAVKTEAQQAVLALHRMRQQLVKMRTMQINELRGLLTEYGEVFAQGRASLTRGMANALDRLATRLPRVVIDSLCEQWQNVSKLDKQVKQIELRLKALLKEDRNAQRILTIPGVGLLRRWAMPMPSNPGVSSRPGWAWCRRTPARVARRECWESANAGTPICARCSSTARGACSRAARNRVRGCRRSAGAGR